MKFVPDKKDLFHPGFSPESSLMQKLQLAGLLARSLLIDLPILARLDSGMEFQQS